MNRKDRRRVIAENRAYVASLPEILTPVAPEEIPQMAITPIAVWRSRHYLVQLYDESARYPNMKRMSISRTRLRSDGHWEEGLSWDELQQIKRECGFGEWYGLEVYPRDSDVINVANFRRLRQQPQVLPIGF